MSFIVSFTASANVFSKPAPADPPISVNKDRYYVDLEIQLLRLLVHVFIRYKPDFSQFEGVYKFLRTIFVLFT